MTAGSESELLLLYVLLALATSTALSDIPLFTIVNTSSTPGDVRFNVDSDGDIAYDGSATTPAADYAEYFYSQDIDLTSGEAVCVDPARNNTVKRCSREADDNIMGIISTKAVDHW